MLIANTSSFLTSVNITEIESHVEHRIGLGENNFRCFRSCNWFCICAFFIVCICLIVLHANQAGKIPAYNTSIAHRFAVGAVHCECASLIMKNA